MVRDILPGRLTVKQIVPGETQQGRAPCNPIFFQYDLVAVIALFAHYPGCSGHAVSPEQFLVKIMDLDGLDIANNRDISGCTLALIVFTHTGIRFMT